MSYSITIRGKTKQEAKERAASTLLATLKGQQGHDGDRDLIVSDVEKRVEVLRDPSETEEIVVEAYGHGQSTWNGTSYEGGMTRSESTLKVYVATALAP